MVEWPIVGLDLFPLAYNILLIFYLTVTATTRTTSAADWARNGEIVLIDE